MNQDSVSAPTLPPPAASLPPATTKPAPTPRQPWWRLFATKRFFLISLALHLLLAGGATIWIVQVVMPSRKPAFAAPPSATKAATHAMEHQVKMAKKQASMSAPPAVKRIVTKSAAKIALPAVPTVPASQPVLPVAMSGTGVMPGAGFGFGSGMGGGGGGGGGGGNITNFIGGMRVTAQKLGVALDTSGSVATYQKEMHEYVGKAFKGSEISEFSAAGFFSVKSGRGSLGMSVLEFLNSPKHFDSIYVFSDFGETYEAARREGQEDLWPQVQKLVREKKVRLYLHVLPKPSGKLQDSPEMNSAIQLARGSGGGVKTGPMTKISEGSTNATTTATTNGASRL